MIFIIIIIFKMKFQFYIIYLIIGSAFAVDDLDYYNILTVDGGGIRGVISAETIEEMENYAY